MSLAVYANALPNAFVFDDLVTFRANERIRSLAGVLSTLTAADGTGYRPVRYLSFALDHALWGDRAWGYRLSNVVYHAITATFVWGIVRRLTGRPRVALVGALLFCVHPVHTEAVGYVSGRRDVLMALFYLLGVWSFLRAQASASAARAAGWYGLVFVAFALALGVKEMAITLPAVLFLHDALLDRAGLKRRWPVYFALGVLAIGFAAWVVFGRHRVPVAYHGGSAAACYATVVRLVAHYAGLLVWPQTLLADYSLEAFPLSTGFGELRVGLALAVLSGALAGAVAVWRRAPLVTLSVLWFFVTLLPVCHVIPHHELGAEHHLYLPSVGFVLLAALGFDRLYGRLGVRRAGALAGLVMLALAGRAVVRNADWRDEETLWRKTAATAPRCARAQANLGSLLARSGAYGEAKAHLEAAIAIRPDHVFARMTLARVHGLSGQPEAARAELEEALRTVERLDPSPVPRSTLLIALGRFHEALPLVLQSIEDHPKKLEHYRELALCLEGLERPEEALKVYDAYLHERPRDVGALRRAALLAERLGQPERAEVLRVQAERAAASLGWR